MRPFMSHVFIGTAIVVGAMAQPADAAEDYRKRWKATDGGAANTEFINIDDQTWFSTDDNGGRAKWKVTSITPFCIYLESSNAKGTIYGYLTDTEHGYRMDDTPTTRIPGGWVPSR